MASDRYIGQFRPEFSRLYLDADLPWLIPLPASMVVTVVGERFSGKTTVVHYLEERHRFRTFRVPDYLREVALRRGVTVPDRRSLLAFADALRAEKGDPSFLSAEVVRRARRRLLAEARQTPSPIIISGLKHPAEVALLRQMTSFHLVHVMANDAIRLQRAIAARRLAADATVDDLNDQFDRQEREGVPSSVPDAMRGGVQRLFEENADARVIENNGVNRRELYQAIDMAVKDLRAEQRRRG